MFRISEELFQTYVEEAWSHIPARFRRQARNLSIEIEARPSPEERAMFGPGLLGLFQGVPLPERTTQWAYGPDRIVLYQRNLEAVAQSAEELRQQIALTLRHELGHFFGMSEKHLRRRGY